MYLNDASEKGNGAPRRRRRDPVGQGFPLVRAPNSATPEGLEDRQAPGSNPWGWEPRLKPATVFRSEAEVD
jgi:hypothetical protein